MFAIALVSAEATQSFEELPSITANKLWSLTHSLSLCLPGSMERWGASLWAEFERNRSFHSRSVKLLLSFRQILRASLHRINTYLNAATRAVASYLIILSRPIIGSTIGFLYWSGGSVGTVSGGGNV